MLNLRSIDRDGGSQASADPQHHSQFSCPNFKVPSFIGNIGEDLDNTQPEEREEIELVPITAVDFMHEEFAFETRRSAEGFGGKSRTSCIY